MERGKTGDPVHCDGHARAWSRIFSGMTPDHAYDLARALAAENRELRELLEAVAQELEALRGPPTLS